MISSGENPPSLETLFTIARYLEYRIRSKGAGSIHSPFVFDFFNQVLASPYTFYAFRELEMARRELLQDSRHLEFPDPGTGNGIRKGTVGQLAKRSLMPPEKAEILFRLVHWMQPQTVLELGTSFGLTTAYLSKAHTSRIVTIEGVPEIAERAAQLWKGIKLGPIESITGKIEKLLPDWLSQPQNRPDLAVVDANHSYEATMTNFRLLAEKMPDTGCLVFDDIYWSRGMARAWTEIKADPRVTVTIDIFDLGFVFFRKESQKENFVLRCRENEY